MTSQASHQGWRVSSFSNDGGDCFEVKLNADDTGAIANVQLRHSKHPDEAVFVISPHAWKTWLDEVEHGITNATSDLEVTVTDSGWLVREVSTGEALEFTWSEVVAFQRGVANGEFALTSVTMVR